MKLLTKSAVLLQSAIIAFSFATSANAEMTKFETATISAQSSDLTPFTPASWKALEAKLQSLSPSEIIVLDIDRTDAAAGTEQTAAAMNGGTLVRKGEGYFEFLSMGRSIDQAYHATLKDSFPDLRSLDLGTFDQGFSVASTGPEEDEENYNVRITIFKLKTAQVTGTFSLKVNGEYDIYFPDGTTIMSSNELPVDGGTQKTYKLIGAGGAEAIIESVDAQLKDAGVPSEYQHTGSMSVLRTGAEVGVTTVTAAPFPGEDAQSIVIVKVVKP